MPDDRSASVLAFIGLGSNVGDRETVIRQALANIEGPHGSMVAVSDLIETVPVGGPSGQGLFLNGAACFRTTSTPRLFLQHLLAVEKALGRRRTPGLRNEPRSIDLDLLLFGDQILEEDELCVPHPRLHQREFVLIPLAQIAPHLIHPILGKTIRELLGDLKMPHQPTP